MVRTKKLTKSAGTNHKPGRKRKPAVAARVAEIKRTTAETSVQLKLNLDGSGKHKIATGVGFLDHMLVLLARHGFVDLEMQAQGDLEVDSHHTVEDCGLALGQALKQALGDKTGIHRYGEALIPMDETLVQVALDFSGRPFLVFHAEIPKLKLGNFDTEMAEEFFRAVAMESGLTLHINVLYGSNVHHLIEGMFKAFARALAQAVAMDSRVHGVMSSKGTL
jgi:imidazoleglycerol-phosphate dehydratase